LIGGGVALVFSQVLFTPEPVRLLRRAEAAALTDVGNAFDLTARAIDEDDKDLATRATGSLRDVRDRLADLGRTRDASQQVARRSAAWRSQRDPVVEENENAGQLDLLGASALMLVRSATAAEGGGREVLAAAIRDLAGRVHDLARDPGDRGVRQQAADGVLKAVRRLRSDDRVRGAAPDSALAAAVVSMSSAAADIMIFAGVDADAAEQALQRDDAELEGPAPAHSPRTPFKHLWEPWKRAAK
jgi:hypothetical protein